MSVEGVRKALDTIAALWALSARPPATSRSQRRTAPASRPPMPEHALDLRVGIARDLASWAHMVAEARDLRPRIDAGDTPAVAAWLHTHVEALRVVAPEVDDELPEHAARLRATVAPPEPRPEPGRSVVDHEDELVEQWVTIAHAAAVLRYLRPACPPSEVTIRAWAGQTGRRPVLYVDGGLVRIGSVVELTDTRTDLRKHSRVTRGAWSV